MFPSMIGRQLQWDPRGSVSLESSTTQKCVKVPVAVETSSCKSYGSRSHANMNRYVHVLARQTSARPWLGVISRANLSR
ncbi:hypothetical protein L484_014690 [Morus notabilis]|uniref:Uncharacterized protein n=1 Tax=Morus notabilis TaxID=981085 RepID=W9SBZ0_9ROSA|nr:hypothetical protein L484_014690 [Morus notabilis]